MKSDWSRFPWALIFSCISISSLFVFYPSIGIVSILPGITMHRCQSHPPQCFPITANPVKRECVNVDVSRIFGPTLHQASVVQLIDGRHVVSRKRRNQRQQGPRAVKFRNSKMWLSFSTRYINGSTYIDHVKSKNCVLTRYEQKDGYVGYLVGLRNHP